MQTELLVGNTYLLPVAIEVTGLERLSLSLKSTKCSHHHRSDLGAVRGFPFAIFAQRQRHLYLPVIWRYQCRVATLELHQHEHNLTKCLHSTSPLWSSISRLPTAAAGQAVLAAHRLPDPTVNQLLALKRKQHSFSSHCCLFSSFSVVLTKMHVSKKKKKGKQTDSHLSKFSYIITVALSFPGCNRRGIVNLALGSA